MPTETTPEHTPINAALRHHQLCVVAHRLPYLYDDEGWQRSPGGLVSALESSLDESGGRWFGYSTHRGPIPARRQGRIEYVGLNLDQRTQDEAIDGCCNRTLWPALHGVTGNVEESDDWWIRYFAHNDRTAAEIAASAQAGALVWVHDYHYFAVASELARLRRDLRVGLFCHTPVDASHLRKLSRGRELLRRMAGFDMIATQTEHDADALRGQLASSGLDEVPVHAIPVGIDVEAWTALGHDPDTHRRADTIAGGDGLLVVGIDRADYTKGLVAKLLAFEVALGRGSISPDDLRLVQVAIPTRTGIAAYDHVLAESADIAARVNQTFERTDGRDVIEFSTESRDRPEIAALMRAADVMLITPLRDGMNLVALESSTVNADRATEMILSRQAGAASYIGDDCRLVRGADVLSIADALDSVVHAPSSEEQRRERSARRARSARELTARRWVDTFTTLLAERDLDHPVFGRSPGDRPGPSDGR